MHIWSSKRLNMSRNLLRLNRLTRQLWFKRWILSHSIRLWRGSVSLSFYSFVRFAEITVILMALDLFVSSCCSNSNFCNSRRWEKWTAVTFTPINQEFYSLWPFGRFCLFIFWLKERAKISKWSKTLKENECRGGCNALVWVFFLVPRTLVDI